MYTVHVVKGLCVFLTQERICPVRVEELRQQREEVQKTIDNVTKVRQL